MRIGFIGLGNMGTPMASNLARAGHEVWGFDVAGNQAESVKTTKTAQEAIIEADVIVTMLPNGAILRSVADDVLEHAKRPSISIDCSTVDIESARTVHASCQEAGILSVDAPVSGGIGGAAGGTLTFMAGGTRDAMNAASPILAIMGSKIVHCGAGGSGQAAKICNNMILGVSMIGVCEAFALGTKLDLNPQSLFDVVSTSSGSCWSVNTYCPAPSVGPSSPSDNDYLPGFAAELMPKDLLLSQDAAELVDADTPMGGKAGEIFAKFGKNGGLGKDFSALLPAFAASKRGAFDV